jgi:transposase
MYINFSGFIGQDKSSLYPSILSITLAFSYEQYRDSDRNFNHKMALFTHAVQMLSNKEKNRYKKNLQNTLHSWSSYQLQTQIGYKTRLLGIPIEHNDPHYTSQICSKCRHTDKKRR